MVRSQRRMEAEKCLYTNRNQDTNRERDNLGKMKELNKEILNAKKNYNS